MDGRLGDWEPAPNEWRQWQDLQRIQKQGGPRLPVNPLARLAENALGRTATEITEGTGAGKADQPVTTLLRDQNDQKRRAVNSRLAQAQKAGIGPIIQRCKAVLARLPQLAELRATSTPRQPSTLTAHWPTEAVG